MAVVFATELLFDAVVARFAAEGTSVENVFGWSKPTKQTAVNRICWVPGDVDGKLGTIGAPKQPGRMPRPLMTLGEIIRFEIYGRDPSDPTNEMKQYKANCLIRDALLRALYLKGRGWVQVVDIERIKPEQNEMSNGFSTRITAIVDNMIPDSPVEIAPIDTGADVDVNVKVNGTDIALTEDIVIPGLSAETNEEGTAIIIAFPGPVSHVGDVDFESELIVSGATALSGSFTDETHYTIAIEEIDAEAELLITYAPTVFKYFTVSNLPYGAFAIAATNLVEP